MLLNSIDKIQLKKTDTMKRLIQFAILILGITSCQNPTKKPIKNPDLLRNKISQIVSNKKAVVGVSIIGTEQNDTISLNGDKHYPMQSVFKMHIALAVLSEIDKGKLALDQKIEVKQDELLPKGIWSPLRDENPTGGSFTIAKLIQYAVSQSDNVACDVLIRLIGTPKTVEQYFKKNAIDEIAITFNEKDMQAQWENMFENWTTPKSASKTLQIFYQNNKNKLSKNSYDFFWKTMKETSTCPNRLKGLLPKETIVAHKTGSSGTNENGITAATNDIGIVFLPNGKYFIVSVFITDSKETEQTNEKIIAEIAKAAYEHYSKTSK